MMDHSVLKMLQSHPAKSGMDMARLADCIQACMDCAETCTSCADACLAESKPDMLRRCIAMNQNCADMCYLTVRMISRQTDADWSMLSDQVRLMAKMCGQCAAECDRHASHHKHCLICAETCRACEEACKAMLKSIPAMRAAA